MDLQGRKNTLAALGNLLRSHPASWQEAVRRAEQQNPWFTQDFIKLATENIVDRFLQPAVLDEEALRDLRQRQLRARGGSVPVLQEDG